MHRHELTDEEWVRLEPLLPPERARRGRPAKLPNRKFINAVTYVAKTGVPWRDLPERFGPWKTVFNKWSRWNAKGVFERILDAFSKDADNESSIVDASIVRAHQHSAGGKGGPKLSVLDALAEVLAPRSTHLSTLWEIQFTSTSRPPTFTTSSKHPSSSNSPRVRTSSATKATTPKRSFKPSTKRA